MSLKYEVFGDNLPAVSIVLDEGDSIYTQSGGMSWMDTGIDMSTNMKGGIGKALGRMFSGESLFIATYTATQNNREIVFASSFPGHILAVELDGVSSIIAQKNAFMCAEDGVDVSAHIVKGMAGGFFGGEGFVLQRFSGYGHAFIEIDGSVSEKVLRRGEKIKVNSGNVAAYEESVRYEVETVRGFKNIFFGGEGLFLTTLTGPGKVWLQTMTLPGLAQRLIPFMPQPSSK